MTESSIVCRAESFLGQCTVAVLVVIGLGTMIGLMKPSDSARHCGVVVAVNLILVIFVSVFVGLWATMSLWQRVVVVAMVLALWRIQRQQHLPRKKRKED